MKTKLILIKLISSLLLVCCLGSEIGVPVLLWQQKTDSNLFDSKSTINQIDGKILAEDYLENSQTVVAFIQNRLSLEQFTTEDEDRITTVKSIFKDQSIKPTLLIDVLNPTEALIEKHFQHQKWDQIHVKNGDKVWIQLPEDSLAENNLLLSELMAQIQKNVSKNALFLITGRQNQYQSIDLEPQMTQEVHKRVVRAAQSKDTIKETEDEDDSYLINVEDCLFMYTTSITLNNITSGAEELAQFHTTRNITDYSGSSCWPTNATSNETALLHLIYKGSNDTQLTLKLFIQNKGKNYFWGIDTNTSRITIKSESIPKIKTGVEFEIYGNEVESEQGFGYSCGQLTIASKPQNDSQNHEMRISLTFTRFQLQPFANPFSKKGAKNHLIFTDSFDCQVWMTLPLWMGLLTLIVMFIILSIGVYFIAIVNTPDRFENPKAKPLVITAIED